MILKKKQGKICIFIWGAGKAVEESRSVKGHHRFKIFSFISQQGFEL